MKVVFLWTLNSLRSDILWRFACGDVFYICAGLASSDQKYPQIIRWHIVICGMILYNAEEDAAVEVGASPRAVEADIQHRENY